MSKVVLGVVNLAYADEEGGTTTHEVAEILEKKYGVMDVFVQAHRQAILDDVSKAYVTMLKRYLKTGSAWGNHHEFPLERTDAEFRDYLSRDEWQKLTGRTIGAAQGGISSRKKAGRYETARPAFIDTGLYRRSFRAFLQK